MSVPPVRRSTIEAVARFPSGEISGSPPLKNSAGSPTVSRIAPLRSSHRSDRERLPLPGLVDEHAVSRGREDAAAEPLVHENVGDERDGLALDREPVEVERLRHERAFADVEEVPRRVNDVRGDVQDELRLPRIERSDANLRVATGSGAAAVRTR